MFEAFLESIVKTATPLLLAAMGEMIVEQSGVINIGIEGVMLSAAFFAMATAYFSASPLLGLLAGIGAALLITAIFAGLAVNLAVNQVVAGTAINLFAVGLTGIFYRRLFGITGSAFTVRTFNSLPLGPLSRIPLFGRALFDQDAIVYTAFSLVPLVALLFRRTRFALRLRAAGERPAAADALGLDVYRLRWQALAASAVLTGIGGAYLTLAYTNTFVEGISAGRGFIALSIVVLGRWNSWGLLASSLLFGTAIAFQFGLQALGTTAPYQLFLALPYLLTLLVLAAIGDSARAPSALGEPYRRA